MTDPAARPVRARTERPAMQMLEIHATDGMTVEQKRLERMEERFSHLEDVLCNTREDLFSTRDALEALKASVQPG